MIRYAELIWTLRPPFVVEVGTNDGGTALYLSDLMRGIGPVITIDVNRPHGDLDAEADNLIVLTGDSLSDRILSEVFMETGGGRGLVTLDGDHSHNQVVHELEEYAPLADYLICQDTIMRWLGHAEGPHTALREFLTGHPDDWLIQPDTAASQHPGGYLKRVSG